MTSAEIARQTGEILRSVQFNFPRADVGIMRKIPGMHDCDRSVQILDHLKAMWGLKDAPRSHWHES
eukprot:11579428-Prorocentrum_lima.AAC.1